MKKDELIEKMRALKEEWGTDSEVLHGKADELILEYCGPAVEAAYWALFEGTWYATA